MSTTAEWEGFAQHFPPLLFDALLRALGPGVVDARARAALALPQCVVSDRCAAALRRNGTCQTCADDATCSGERRGRHGLPLDRPPKPAPQLADTRTRTRTHIAHRPHATHTSAEHWGLGPGHRCDAAPAFAASRLCYQRKPGRPAPTLLGLLF